MMTLLDTTLVMGGANGWLGLLMKIAIICVIAWAIKALIDWMGWTIPRPVMIILIALVCIILIIWLFQLAALLI